MAQMYEMIEHAEETRQRILIDGLDSLLNFHNMSDNLSNDDIMKVRQFVGACLTIELAQMHLDNQQEEYPDIFG